MTRRLLAFFAPGLLMAQTKAKPHYTTGRLCLATEADDCQVQRPRPKNGQCPVCGTVAEPFTMSTCPQGQMCPVTEDYRSASRRIDCAHCNTTFRQWAEGKEPKR